MIAFRSLTAALRASVQPIKSDAALPSIRNFSNGQQLLSFNHPLTKPSGSPLTPPSSSSILSKYHNLLINQSRTIMKIFWQRPKESKRIGNHGWKTRMSTPSGRRIIMRRILRGRHILTH